MTLSVFEPIVPANERPVFYTNLPGSSLALALSNLALQSDQVIFVVAPSAQYASSLKEACGFFVPELPCLVFPSWETLAYDQFSPHQAIISERLLTLNRLPLMQKGLVIASVPTLLQRLSPTDYLVSEVFDLKVGDVFKIDAMRQRLAQAGYHAVSQVALPGEFAVRGALFDIFPMGATLPFRLDLFDDEIETIKPFDVNSQCSIASVDKIEILPAHEFPLHSDSIKAFRLRFREQFAVNPSNCPVYQAVSAGETPPGIDYYLPLFFEKTATLFDYLPKETLIVRWHDLPTLAESEWAEIRGRYDQRCHDITRPILAPVKLFLSVDELFGQLKNFKQVIYSDNPVEHAQAFAVQSLPDLHFKAGHSQPFSHLQQFILTHPEHKIAFSAETAGRREALLELLKTIGISPPICASWQDFIAQPQSVQILISPLDSGFYLEDSSLTLIPEAALLGLPASSARRRKVRDFDTELVIRNLTELTIGAPIVHIEHGVGRYQGLEVLKVGDIEGEFLKISYQDSQLFVPVAAMHLISRYSGAEHAPLHRLGSDVWQKAVRKAAEQVRDVAAELLSVYAARAARTGFQYATPDESYQAFAASFAFEETEDQQTAIAAVLSDMAASQPMDRLICGDVGFGKTEVALRAAFLAVQAGRQVAILVPTTLLAQQHYETFCDRMAAWPIKVAVLSRFRTAKEQKEVIEQLANGRVDIVIGTHKLVQEGVKFHNLGLVVIDEEHRFGVRQKERLKALRTEVDILSMTATPIPRTLNMAMAQIRDLSIIATPPAKRLAIKTLVREYNLPLIKEAIQREILRGGQVYFLHNRVDTIEQMAEELRVLVPEARLIVAHGQMHERELERVMDDFHHQRFNVLVCSTIIETGIDIPSANTMIINRADKFGLAQLHQLRGRVGRSHHQAYAYLLTPVGQKLTPDAQKRLEAISTLEELGAGFVLATHDLEIRGAGELLGEEQSGQINTIGFSLYSEMLDRAVKALQRGDVVDLDQAQEKDIDIDLQIPALIPDSWVPDVTLRLILYKRLSSAQDEAALRALKVEMIDRFGALPEPCKNLFDILHLKFLAEVWGLKKIEANAKGGRIEFSKDHKLDPLKLIRLIQVRSHEFKLDGSTRLKFFWNPEVEREDRYAAMCATLEKLIG